MAEAIDFNAGALPATHHIGPRCSYCGCTPEGEHSRRCAVTKHGSDPMWGEWADDIKRERDALRTRVAELETALLEIASMNWRKERDGWAADKASAAMKGNHADT